MKKKTVTILAVEHSRRVCASKPPFIDRLEVSRMVIRAFRAGYNKAKNMEEEK